MSEPLISVLLPMYNGENYIINSLKSIQNQTYKNYEIIVVDDGSKDNSYKLVEEIAKSDKRIKLYHKENEKYVSITRNYLLSKVRGEFFIFMDSDDFVSPLYLELLMRAIMETDADIACCGYTIRKRNLSKKSKLKNLITIDDRHEALAKMILTNKGKFMVWNKLINSKLLGKINFDSSLHFGEDFVFTFDLLQNDLKIAFIDNKLYYYELFNGGISKGGFTQKKRDFLDKMIEMEVNPKYQEDKQILTSWIYITAGLYRFLLIFKRGYKDYKKELRTIMKARKEAYKKEKRMCHLYRFLMKLVRV